MLRLNTIRVTTRFQQFSLDIYEIWGPLQKQFVNYDIFKMYAFSYLASALFEQQKIQKPCCKIEIISTHTLL